MTSLAPSRIDPSAVGLYLSPVIQPGENIRGRVGLAALLASLALLPLSLGCAGEPRREPRPQLAHDDPALAPVAFLSGAWGTQRGEDIIEEQWTRPAGGLMLGAGRTIRGGKAVFFEFLRIESAPGSLVYIAQPMGKSETAFPLKEAGEGRAIFENPEHDFPKRISYAHKRNGELDVRIEGLQGGQPASEEWVMRRAE